MSESARGPLAFIIGLVSATRRAVRCLPLATLFLTLAAACSRAPQDPVLAFLVELEQAAEARDAERLAQHLAADYRDARGLDRAGSVAELRRWFAAYESVEVELFEPRVEKREAGAAHVSCTVGFSGRARPLPGLAGLLPPSAVYRFRLELAEEAGAWRVRTAGWEPAPPAEPMP